MHYPLIVPNYLTSSGGEILPTAAAAEPFSMEMKRQKLRQNISNSSAIAIRYGSASHNGLHKTWKTNGDK